MVDEVSLVRDENARVIIADREKRIDELQLPNDTPDDEVERRVLDRYALRKATPEEIAAGKVTHIGLATRYRDRANFVNGDGRTVLIDEMIVRNRKTGRIEGIAD